MTTIDQFPVSGWVAEGLEPVHAVFENNFIKHGEVGAALHVTLNGKPIIDLWGGSANAANTQAWSPDNIVNVWSTTKGWLATSMHMLADRGLLDFEAPVAKYWPEFAQHDKDKVLVKHILTHTSGLLAPSLKVPDEAVYEWDTMIHALEQSTLFWEPGTKCGYHAATFGWLNGEILRRITGKSVGEFIRTEIAEPLGADIFVGLTKQEQARAADTIPPLLSPGNAVFNTALTLLGSRERLLVISNPPRRPKVANTVRWREAEIPSSNGHASARGLARLYTMLAMGGEVDGILLLSEASVKRARQEAAHMKDMIAGAVIRRSLGFMLPSTSDDPRPLTAFGHDGMGGSIGFADPQNRLAFGYVMNKMILGPDTRAADLYRALYKCLKA